MKIYHLYLANRELDADGQRTTVRLPPTTPRDLSDYLGIKIVQNSDGTMEWSQPTLTNSILKDLGLVDVKTSNQPTTRTTPSLTTVIGP